MGQLKGTVIYRQLITRDPVLQVFIATRLRIYALDSSMAEVPANPTFTRSMFTSEFSNNILGQAEIVGTFTPDSSPSQETFSVTVADNNNGPGRVYVINGQQKKLAYPKCWHKIHFHSSGGAPVKIFYYSRWN